MNERHTTHFDDCGCLSDRLIARSETVERELSALRAAVRWCMSNGVTLSPSLDGSGEYLVWTAGDKMPPEHADALRKAIE
jgi:hypothetical protein